MRRGVIACYAISIQRLWHSLSQPYTHARAEQSYPRKHSTNAIIRTHSMHTHIHTHTHSNIAFQYELRIHIFTFFGVQVSSTQKVFNTVGMMPAQDLFSILKLVGPLLPMLLKNKWDTRDKVHTLNCMLIWFHSHKCTLIRCDMHIGILI